LIFFPFRDEDAIVIVKSRRLGTKRANNSKKPIIKKGLNEGRLVEAKKVYRA